MADNFEFSIEIPDSGFTRAQLMGMLRGMIPAGGLVDGQTIVISSGKLMVGGINANQLVAGTIPAERFPGTLPSGDGRNLTNLNADELKSGTIPNGRFPAELPAVDGRNLTNLKNLDAGELKEGTIPDGRFPEILPVSDGKHLTNLNADELKSGTLPDDRLTQLLKEIAGLNTPGILYQNGSKVIELKHIGQDIQAHSDLLQGVADAGRGAAVADVDTTDLPGTIGAAYDQAEVDGLRKTIANLVTTVETLRDRLRVTGGNGLLEDA